MRVVPVHAYGIAATLRPKDVATLFGWTTRQSEAKHRITKTMATSVHDGSRIIVVHDFGAVVFFDCAKEERESFMERLLASVPPEPHKPLLEDYLIELRDDAEATIRFDRAVLPRLEPPLAELLSLVLAQSVAMDYYEEDVRAMYARVADFATTLAATGRLRRSQRELAKFVGTNLATRNQIAMTLSLLDAPELTWEQEIYDRIYRAMRAVFEIEDRYRTIEHKMALIQDNLEIVVELAQHRRSEVLELTVIGLITFEVLLAVWEKFLHVR